MSINHTVGRILARYLSKEPSDRRRESKLTDFTRVCHEIIPGDILLIEGHNRASKIIKRMTASCWTHVALYIGRVHSITNHSTRQTVESHFIGSPTSQLFVDTMPGTGTRVVPAEHYEGLHLRICRPNGLSADDAQKVIDFVAKHLGREYNMKHLCQLGLYGALGRIIPRRCLAGLFEHRKQQQATRDICSALIAEAFIHVNFPVLPLIVDNATDLAMIHRNPRLYKPCDFDYSPYFNIIKYPIIPGKHNGIYHHFPWRNEATSHDEFVSEESETGTHIIDHE